MKSRWFDEYGRLEWLEPTDYYGQPWSYVRTAEADDGEQYDIVRNHDNTKYCYTTI